MYLALYIYPSLHRTICLICHMTLGVGKEGSKSQVFWVPCPQVEQRGCAPVFCSVEDRGEDLEPQGGDWSHIGARRAQQDLTKPEDGMYRGQEDWPCTVVTGPTALSAS